MITLRTLPSAEAAVDLRAGKIDAMFVLGTYPAGAVRAATADGRAYVVPIAGPARPTACALDSGFLRAALVPAKPIRDRRPRFGRWASRTCSCAGAISATSWSTSSRNSFSSRCPVCRCLFSSLRLIDVYHASATSIPLHDGAVRFYRERELLR